MHVCCVFNNSGSAFLSAWLFLPWWKDCTLASTEKPVYVLQMYYLNPVTWTLYGLVASNVGDVVGDITLNDGTVKTVQQFLLDQFDYRHDYLGWVVLILVGWTIVFWAGGAYAFKKFNFQKR